MSVTMAHTRRVERVKGSEKLTADVILSGLAAQQMQCLFCDVTLRVEDREIHAHRGVLSAASDYFMSMFTADFKEKNEKLITLNGVSYKGLSAIIDYMYTLKLKIDVDTLPDILSTAHLLQVSGIIDDCVAYMIKRMCTATCLEFRILGEKYQLDKVAETADVFCLKNFVDVSKTEEFKELSKEALLAYISNDCLNFMGNEFHVFNAAKRWLEAEPSRKQHTVEVMKNVRFMLIRSQILDKMLDLPIIEDEKTCQHLIREAIQYHCKVFEQPLHTSPQNRPRGMKDILTVDVGMVSCLEYTNLADETFFHYNTVHRERDSSTVQRIDKEIPVLLISFSTNLIKCNNFLFIFGTQNNTFLTVTMRYDASLSKWMQLLPVPRQATVGSSAALSGKNIFLLCGTFVTKSCTRIDKQTLNTGVAYRYHIPTNLWHKLPDVPRKLSDANACSVFDTVYISGGEFTDYTGVIELSNRLYAFDMKAGMWLSKTSMMNPRAGHSMEAVGDTIYVLGGDDYADPDTTTPEMYDVVSEQWSLLDGKKPPPYSWAGVLCHENDIFLVGCHMGDRDGDVTTIFILDTHEKTYREYDRKLLTNDQNQGVCGFFVLPELL